MLAGPAATITAYVGRSENTWHKLVNGSPSRFIYAYDYWDVVVAINVLMIENKVYLGIH